MKAIIVDLDGTLVNVDGLYHYVKGEDRDYDAYHKRVLDAPPIQWATSFVQAARNSGLKIVISTARSYKYGESSLAWLYRYNIDIDDLFMRSEYAEHATDVEVKSLNLETIETCYDPVLALEDNPELIQMYRENGIPVVDVGTWPSD